MEIFDLLFYFVLETWRYFFCITVKTQIWYIFDGDTMILIEMIHFVYFENFAWFSGLLLATDVFFWQHGLVFWFFDRWGLMKHLKQSHRLSSNLRIAAIGYYCYVLGLLITSVSDSDDFCSILENWLNAVQPRALSSI